VTRVLDRVRWLATLPEGTRHAFVLPESTTDVGLRESACGHVIVTTETALEGAQQVEPSGWCSFCRLALDMPRRVLES